MEEETSNNRSFYGAGSNAEHTSSGVKLSPVRFTFMIITAVLAMFAGAVLWAAITAITNYQIGYMAIAMGFLVGFAVRFTGGGRNFVFAVFSAVLSLIGCALGNILSVVAVSADNQDAGYLEIMSHLDFALILQILSDMFHPMDLLFYGLAVYSAYKVALKSK